MAFSGVSGFGAPYAGMLTSLLSLIVVFGIINAEATILLMFILPVKAKYISYGTVLITILTFLAKANPHAAYHLGGMLLGYITFKGPGRLFPSNSLSAHYHAWRMKRKRSRFTVIDGKKDGDDEGPTYH